jgi:hypothetical protein
MPQYRSKWDSLSDALTMFGQLSQQKTQNQQWEKEIPGMLYDLPMGIYD